jgi:15-cis-phytoene synthase
MSGVWERSDDPSGVPGAAPLDLREAERYCQRMARREAGNFYWGFISLRAEQRVAIYALYDFARQVDDEADMDAGTDVAARLERHRRRAHECANGRWSDPVTRVLARAVLRHGIPESDLQALIDGVQMDLSRTRYATWRQLEGYCRLVASTIGRMCVRIFGFRDPAALKRADELGIALQLVNILRDVREDAGLGRVYLPAQDMARFGVSEAGLLDRQPGPGWEALVAFEAERARGFLESGLGVTAHIPRRPAACVRTMAGIYERVLAMIERDPRLPLHRRASLTPLQKLGVVVRSWVWPA